MIIPCIDLQRGSTVQLVEGRERALDAGDPLPLLRRFGRVGEVAVVDLDAALGDGSNEELVTELCRAGDVRVGGGILIFAYITLEVRRAFQGETLLLTFGTYPQNGEIYAYSVAWIVFALVLLALGIRWVSQPLRYASLAVLLVTVAKVFLYDMSDLTGLFRVASFLGLGLTLIGIGRVYQRYVFKPEPAPETDDPN